MAQMQEANCSTVLKIQLRKQVATKRADKVLSGRPVRSRRCICAGVFVYRWQFV